MAWRGEAGSADGISCEPEVTSSAVRQQVPATVGVHTRARSPPPDVDRPRTIHYSCGDPRVGGTSAATRISLCPTLRETSPTSRHVTSRLVSFRRRENAKRRKRVSCGRAYGAARHVEMTLSPHHCDHRTRRCPNCTFTWRRARTATATETQASSSSSHNPAGRPFINHCAATLPDAQHRPNMRSFNHTSRTIQLHFSSLLQRLIDHLPIPIITSLVNSQFPLVPSFLIFILENLPFVTRDPDFPRAIFPNDIISPTSATKTIINYYHGGFRNRSKLIFVSIECCRCR